MLWFLLIQAGCGVDKLPTSTVGSINFGMLASSFFSFGGIIKYPSKTSTVYSDCGTWIDINATAVSQPPRL